MRIGNRDSLPKGHEILSKRHELLKAIEAINLTILSTGQSTYWPSDKKQTPDLLNFNIPKDYCRAEHRAVCLELSSDHFLVIFTVLQ